MVMNRRHFIKDVSLTTAGLSLVGASRAIAKMENNKVRLGFIGVGLRGQNHIENALRRKDIEVVSIADVDPAMLQMAGSIFKKFGKATPKVHTGSRYAYQRLLADKNIDAVVISTPWEWHKPMIIDAITAGVKYVGTEVVLGITLEDHWAVVHHAEQYKAHVMMLENVCYRRDVLAVLNMVRQNVFGEIIHLQGGYQHDLRGVKFNDGKTPYNSGAEFGEKAFSEARWRTQHSVHRNGDLYPTHGIGPLAMMIDINRGNRFVSLNSFASKARGLNNYVKKKGGKDHPNTQVEFKLGDVVTTNIRCANGETILLQHDTNLPRPYSLGFRVQGTNGIWMDVNNSIYIEGKSKEEHQWERADEWLKKYDHPLWARWSKNTEEAGHGGMDFFVLHAFIESVKRNIATPMDVYDAAAWSAITPLSESSIELGNETVDFPDFTGGQWMKRKNSFALNDEY